MNEVNELKYIRYCSVLIDFKYNNRILIIITEFKKDKLRKRF